MQVYFIPKYFWLQLQISKFTVTTSKKTCKIFCPKQNYFHIFQFFTRSNNLYLQKVLWNFTPKQSIEMISLSKNIRWDDRRVAMETLSLIRVNKILDVTDEHAFDRRTWSFRKKKLRLKIAHWGDMCKFDCIFVTGIM